jgi:hypothetical protein
MEARARNDARDIPGISPSCRPRRLKSAGAGREQSGDPRRSIEERYRGRQDYLNQVGRAAADLVRDRFLLPSDVRGVVERAGQTWEAIVGR